ncbi:unnamed protein product [Didymodactylos carnosus]|uniref:Cep57 centrosome localisation domain-containing protein n=1 Tax=Didymodactylos carnosus TaxID=1234261 RepID=A0A814B2Z1_9BILA|nr:unnamed protein product [Didymodactylos carnosus]CAF0923529.1 unnamed protein product [Didymodactylos carnosus]CAF3586149.1 unnamed protein product [Didymodactylos carnosus]CAF3702525.1 unnamed protein product [Didymodactylos carnosus]
MWSDLSPDTSGFYEYPARKPFINSNYQRLSSTPSKTAALPESNRENLLQALKSLTLKIKNLEDERERAELNLNHITNGVRFRPKSATTASQDTNDADHQLQNAELRFRLLEKQHGKIRQLMEDGLDSSPKKKFIQPFISKRPCSGSTKGSKRKSRPLSKRTKRNKQLVLDGERHYHLDLNTVPFILGASTSPSHNLMSNVQNVIALLKSHNHHLCLTSKEYDTLKSGNTDYRHHRPLSSSSSPTHRLGRPITTTNSFRSTSSSRAFDRNSSNTPTAKSHLYSRIKKLRTEFALMACNHQKLNDKIEKTLDYELRELYENELEQLNFNMQTILNELEQLQKHLKLLLSPLNSGTKDDTNVKYGRNSSPYEYETPLETLKRTKLLQVLLKDTKRSKSRD